MRGKRTILIATVVAIVATAATLGIAALHRHADERRSRYESLVSVEAVANRVTALAWEATARRRVPLPVQAEITAQLRSMEAELGRLRGVGTVGAGPALEAFERLRPGIEDEFALLRAREFDRAEAMDIVVDPATMALRDRLRAAA